jgi:hypothetical protein
MILRISTIYLQIAVNGKNMHSSSANKEFTRYKERLERYLEKY